MSSCVENGCSNFGNALRRGYCNFHANGLSIAISCCHDICHSEGNFRGFNGPSVYIGSIELPNGFSTIAERVPIPGDYIISTVAMNSWMSNSLGRVATVNAADEQALIHFECSSLLTMSFGSHNKQFVVIE